MSDDGSGCDGAERNVGRTDGIVRLPAESDGLDAALGAIADRRRRYVLYYLSGREDEAVEREALADAVCDYHRAAGEAAEEIDREAVATELHHRLLPRLDDAAVLEYDRRQGTVRYEPKASVETLLAVTWAEEFETRE